MIGFDEWDRAVGAVIMVLGFLLLVCLFGASAAYQREKEQPHKIACEAKGGVYIQSHCVRPME